MIATPAVRTFSAADVPEWVRFDDRGVELGTVLDGETCRLGVAFARFAAGTVIDELDSPIPYDEVYVVTRGRVVVRTATERAEAGAGDALFLPRCTAAVYEAHGDVELVSITHPGQARAWRELAEAREDGPRVPDPRARLAVVTAGEAVDATYGSAIDVRLEGGSVHVTAGSSPGKVETVVVRPAGEVTHRPAGA